ncbi:MAG: ParA family protein [Promethearchaeia archaeon]
MTEPKVISFLSAPGGVGKTSIAVLLSWFLKERNKPNLLIDLDPSLGLTLKLKDIQKYYADIENHKRTSADLLKLANRNELAKSDIKQFISRSRFQSVTLDFIASSIRLEDVMGEIWYGSSLGRSKKLQQSLKFIPKKTYNYILIDVIPCYGLKYALLNVIASDICFVPLRITLNDLGRTILMMRELGKKASGEIAVDELQKKLIFIFNMVRHYDEDLVSSYGKRLLKEFPNATYFDNFISKRVHFNRINTQEEKSGDEAKVREAFTPFYEEFEDKLMNSSQLNSFLK